MRVVLLLMFVVFASAAPSHAPDLIPAAYLSPQYVAPPDAPASIVVVGKDEPGERLVVAVAMYVPGSGDSGKRSHRRPLTPLLSGA